ASLNRLGGEYAIASLKVAEVSSSTYRLQKDQSLVTTSVRDYIKRWNLYSSPI
ncbi:MAG: hypothetical protein RLZZ381_3615, partial [Cyanobacteriota bacterium]